MCVGIWNLTNLEYWVPVVILNKIQIYLFGERELLEIITSSKMVLRTGSTISEWGRQLIKGGTLISPFCVLSDGVGGMGIMLLLMKLTLMFLISVGLFRPFYLLYIKFLLFSKYKNSLVQMLISTLSHFNSCNFFPESLSTFLWRFQPQ